MRFGMVFILTVGIVWGVSQTALSGFGLGDVLDKAGSVFSKKKKEKKTEDQKEKEKNWKEYSSSKPQQVAAVRGVDEEEIDLDRLKNGSVRIPRYSVSREKIEKFAEEGRLKNPQ